MGGRGSTSPAAPKGTGAPRRMTTVADATGRPLFMREETREEMMRRVIKAQIAALEPPAMGRRYDLGPATMDVQPLGDGRYSVEVNAAAVDVQGRGYTALGKRLGSRKSVTWEQLVEFAQERVGRSV